MATLSIGERRQLDEPANLLGIVVENGRLEVLALRRRLSELSPEPAQEAHCRLIGHAIRLSGEPGRLCLGVVLGALGAVRVLG